MSGKLMGSVYEIELTHGQQATLLAMADHGDDDGSHVFPSVGRLAWKTGYKRRHIQRMIRELEDLGVLVEVAPATRRLPTEYRIALDAGKPKPAYEPGKDDVAKDTRGDIQDRGDIRDGQGRHPEQSGASPSTPKPSEETSEETSTSGKPDEEELIKRLFDFWITTLEKRGPKFSDKRKRKIRDRLREGFTPAEIAEAIKGVTLSDHHMARNGSRRKYDDIELICRDPEHLEPFRDLYRMQKGKTATRVDVNAEADRIAAAQGIA